MGVNPTLPDLAITGATGALGGRVARRLAGRGVAQRLIVRSVATAPSLAGAIAVAAPSYADTAAILETGRAQAALARAAWKMANHRSDGIREWRVNGHELCAWLLSKKELP
jgi:NAD(P)H dehydrogenase (quinone)